jgi:hypothetical protein
VYSQVKSSNAVGDERLSVASRLMAPQLYRNGL